jgi:trehalose 6-phosphate phosphatase
MHGHELRNAAGLVTLRNPPPDIAADVESKTLSAVAELDGVKLERKNGVGFVLHFRSALHLAQAAAEAAEAIALTTSGEYEVQHGDCVAELKPTGSSKGIALQWLMDEKPFRGRRPVVVGDDLTDEQAFAAASDLGGFGIVVGARAPTLAQYRLPGPAAVRDWLEQLAEELP